MSIQQLSVTDATSLSFNHAELRTAQDAKKVRESAIEFEALLIGQVLEGLERAFAPKDDQSADPARDTVSSLGTHAVAQLLAQRRAFGFADMLERAVPTTAEHTGITGVTIVL